MTLVRWNPARELASMEIDRLNRMFSELWGEGSSRGFVPAVDIYEADGHELVMKVDLPDVAREDINITVDNGVLTLQGERKPDADVRRDSFQRMERMSGSFTRSFTLPTTVDPSGIKAACKDGVLTIRLPQREDAKPKQIVIEG